MIHEVCSVDAGKRLHPHPEESQEHSHDRAQKSWKIRVLQLRWMIPASGLDLIHEL
jgi:hypothetical protein